MTNTPRKHFWPKRWLRSFAGATLATACLSGAIWAGDAQPTTLPKSDSKTDAPKVDPKTPVPAAKEKLITFTMGDKPWAQVMEWYASESGLAFNSDVKPPDATFNFKPPKDLKTGQPRQYTLTEMTDVINETLLAKGFILVRGETTFRLWPSDTKIDPALVRRVSLDELKTLPVRDVVQTVLPLNALIAEDQVTNVQKMMSKIGEVVALTGGRNALLMTDLAGNLRRIADDLKSSESEDGLKAETYSYVCQYIKARDAATQLREFLVGPQEQDGGRRERNPLERFGMQFSPGGFDPRMMDPRMMDPRMLGQGGDGGRRGGFGQRQGKPTNIVADDATNSVHINAPADQVSRGKAFLTKIDVGKEKIVPDRPNWQSYTVPAGTADGFAQALQDQYRQTSVRVRALSGNQIMVYATPADHLDIIEYIRSNEKANKDVTKIISVGSMDLTEAVTQLKAMFPLPERGGPFIAAHPNGTTITVRGKPEQVTDVELVVKALGGGPDGGSAGAGSDTMRIINLKDGSAADLAEAIKQLMEGMGAPPPKVNRPGGPAVPPVPPPTSTPPFPRTLPKPDGPKKGAIIPGAIKTYGLGVRDLDTSKMLAMGGGQIIDPAAEKKKSEEAPLTITAVGDRLIITGSDPKAVAMAHDLARLIVSGKGEGYQVFRLQNANAVEAARVLNEWFNPPQPQQNRNQNPFAAFQFGGGGGNPFGRQQEPPPAEPRIRVVAEQSSNSLLVRAKALDLITIKRMLETVIDVGPGDSKAVMKPFFIGPLQYAVATEVVDILMQVYRESTNAAASQGGMSGAAFGLGGPFGGGFGIGRQQPLDAMGRPKQVSLSIAADDRTNSIVGMATELMAKDIEKVVQVMEEKAKDSTKVVQLVPTGSIDPLLVQEVIDAIQGRTPATQQQMPQGRMGSPFGGGNPFGGGGNTGGFGGGNRFGGGTGGFGGPTGRFGGGGNRGGGGGNRGGGRGGGRGFRAPPDPGSLPGLP